ncbi:N-acetylmuramoyl-L-alanine amidase-like domain-containing protein [Dysgonomonas sp. 25]|uniref:N-acetylmuramoyl-L-alanine amidase-like domain-containing protein n=1 Tax=Dysgonomonas sp. 25 TaxID=2302933 RepID=UPI0013D41EAB|nr:N-acetylmuramoyl-L-alanine amidase-like domain-containing protein [Dysgonomonas sp. 25]NDV68661.1 DUF1460 domain-containing protein [Dysgonomonas sp. 25]
MKTIVSLITILVFLAALPLRASDIEVVGETKQVFAEYIKSVSPQRDKPVNELLIKTAKFFVGKPYIASALDKSPEEKLVVDLTGFDCTTFVENCIALSLALKSDAPDDDLFDVYCSYLRKIRYRNGVIDGYPSRLHYMTDWAYDNEAKGLLENITPTLGGATVDKTIDFMSTHPQSYKHLSADRANLEKIAEIEKNIKTRNNYTIILKKDLPDVNSAINSGDILIFATAIEGLDYSHVGIAYKKANTVHFIHASTKSMKVKIEEQPLQNYCLKSKHCTGVTVLRLQQM